MKVVPICFKFSGQGSHETGIVLQQKLSRLLLATRLIFDSIQSTFEEYRTVGKGNVWEVVWNGPTVGFMEFPFCRMGSCGSSS